MSAAPIAGRALHRAAPWLAAGAVLSSVLLLLGLAPLDGRGGPLDAAARVALAPTCHQEASRALPGFAHARACARCTGIHASGLLAGLLGVLLGAGRISRHARVLAGVAVVAALLMAADVAAGVLGPWDHPWLRAATGLALATAVLLGGFARLARARSPDARVLSPHAVTPALAAGRS